jgi:hypothetical protein
MFRKKPLYPWSKDIDDSMENCAELLAVVSNSATVGRNDFLPFLKNLAYAVWTEATTKSRLKESILPSFSRGGSFGFTTATVSYNENNIKEIVASFLEEEGFYDLLENNSSTEQEKKEDDL